MVRVAGFEPATSCSQSRRNEPDYPTLGIFYLSWWGLKESNLTASHLAYYGKRFTVSR